MRNLIIITACILAFSARGQETNKVDNAGTFSLGARSSIGLVNDGKWQKTAFGTGGQCRIRFSDKVNTDWFLDYLTADLENYAWRADCHIGWSVLYYLSKSNNPTVQPYILAGHCFEYLKFTDNVNAKNYAERYSASVQGGAGVQFNITEKFDVSIVGQYMMHLGTKITAAHVNNETIFSKSKGYGIQDHVLLHISLNYKIGHLWHKKA